MSARRWWAVPVVLLALSACSAGGAPQMVVDAAAAPSVSAAADGPSGDPSATPDPAAPSPDTTDPASPPGSGPDPDRGDPRPRADDQAEDDYVEQEGAKGIDPEAVLEGGYGTCERLARTAEIDRLGAAQAVALGQLPRAWTAVPTLCPELSGVLDAGRGGFPDGTFDVVSGAGGAGTAVGDEPAATVGRGSYTALAATTECVWSTEDATGAILDEGTADDEASARMTIGASVARVMTSGCTVWLLDKGKQ